MERRGERMLRREAIVDAQDGAARQVRQPPAQGVVELEVAHHPAAAVDEQDPPERIGRPVPAGGDTSVACREVLVDDLAHRLPLRRLDQVVAPDDQLTGLFETHRTQVEQPGPPLVQLVDLGMEPRPLAASQRGNEPPDVANVRFHGCLVCSSPVSATTRHMSGVGPIRVTRDRRGLA